MGARRVILDLLDEYGELYGLQLVKLSNGQLRRGLVYVDLSRLEDEELVSSREEPVTRPEIGLPRRLYQITRKGRWARASAERGPSLFALLKPPRLA